MKILVLLGLVLLPAVRANAEPAAHAATLLKLARARIAVAEKRSQGARLRYQTGQAPLTELLESRELVFRAMRDSPIRGAERVKAAEDYRASVAQLAELVKGRVQAGAAGADDLTAVEYRIAEADYWIEEARGP